MNSEDLHREWVDRDGEFSPTYYAHRGPDDTSEALRETLVERVGRDAAVLELGCSAGRHLEHLRADGFADLAGIELNGRAFDVMAETYPDLVETGTFHEAAIEDVVEGFDAGQFDAVFSVETLQHIHPDATWVFDELVRVTDDVLVTVEHEGNTEDAAASEPGVNHVTEDIPLYYRDWHRVFAERGLEQVAASQRKRDTMRTFRVPDDAAR